MHGGILDPRAEEGEESAILSSVDEIMSEVRKLITKCRTLEARLEDSVPKKVYQDTVAKMQHVIDGLNSELSRKKEELERTVTVGSRMETLTNQVISLSEVISSQRDEIKSLSSKVSSESVPIEVHEQNKARIRELEEKILTMVPREEYLKVKNELSESVPISKYEELRRALDRTADEISSFVSSPSVPISTSSPASKSRPEISEIQSSVAELSTASEINSKGVEASQGEPPHTTQNGNGFRFDGTNLNVTTGPEFFENLEKLDPKTIETHLKNGDFEKWFQDVLHDEDARKLIMQVRESSAGYPSGTIKARMVTTLAKKYRK